MSIIAFGDRVEVYPDLHHPETPSGYGTVTRHYVQVTESDNPGWQHVFVVRLDNGQTVHAPSRFVALEVPMGTCDMCEAAPATVTLDLTTFGDDTEGSDPMTHLCATCLEALGKS